MRAFIALELTDEIRNKLAILQNQLKTYNGKIKWVNPKQIHVTMKFLGDITPPQAEQLSEDLRYIAADFSPFHFDVGRIGTFPGKKVPRIVWVGVENTPLLQELQQEIESAAEAIGVEREKRNFSPHLTLGRVKELDDPEDFRRFLYGHTLETTSNRVDRIVLFKSRLTPSGPIYSEYAVIPLR